MMRQYRARLSFGRTYGWMMGLFALSLLLFVLLMALTGGVSGGSGS